MTHLRALRYGGQAASAQLNKAIARRSPKMAKLTRAVLAKLRPRFPGASELVYDKRNALVIGFCADDRASTAVNSIAVYTKWINLYFFEGDTLPDPEGLLKGGGTTVRSIRITDAKELDRPAVKALMKAARLSADPPLNPKATRRVIIRQSL